MMMLSLPAEAPHLICFTEHHLKYYELNNTHIPKYKLGANYCRKNLKWGGLCIYVHETLTFSKEQDIEIAVIQLNIQKQKVIIFVFIGLHVAILIAFSISWKLYLILFINII